jgi:hypothetical protein
VPGIGPAGFVFVAGYAIVVIAIIALPIVVLREMHRRGSSSTGSSDA